VSGRGGVGKTELIRQVVEMFTAAGYEGRIDVMASTHVQAANANGKTILSHLHKCSRCKERILVIDELSMISLAVFAYLAESAFIGAVFVVIGDEFQIPPIGESLERWQQFQKVTSSTTSATYFA